jgi:hypothetical protein
MKLFTINRLDLLGFSVLIIFTMAEAASTEKPALDHPCPTFMTESVNCNPKTTETIQRQAEGEIEPLSEEDITRFPDLADKTKAAEPGQASSLQYEPTVVEVHGMLKSGKREHPNGEMFDFYIIKLDSPVSISADKDNEINVAELDVKEIQVYSNEPAIRKSMAALVDKHIAAKGTIFHEHTAWHVRVLVMDVQDLNQK